jgi:hypothetical protein
LPEGRLVIVVEGDLAALATEIPPAASLEDLMSTAEGVAALAIEHNRILTEFTRAADIVPLRLDSFHSDERALAAMLEREAARLNRSLERINGCVEYAVKLEPAPRPASDAAQAPASGRDYLAARLKARDRASTQRADTERVIESVLTAFAAASEAFMLTPTPAAARGKIVAAAAFLVPRPDRAAFAELVETVSAEALAGGLRLTASGPWPPYHFGDATKEADAGSD